MGTITKIQMILIRIDTKMDNKFSKIVEKQFRIKTFLPKRIKEYLITNFKKSKNLQKNKFIIQMS